MSMNLVLFQKELYNLEQNSIDNMKPQVYKRDIAIMLPSIKFRTSNVSILASTFPQMIKRFTLVLYLREEFKLRCICVFLDFLVNPIHEKC